jgi:NAD(P)-dependent dehydrogenase (short-subunit alcohol dehydrogenase family)
MSPSAGNGLLDGRIALVTGAGSNNGRAIALAFAAQGAAVAVQDFSHERADRTVAEIAEAGGRAIAIGADITAEAEVERVFARAESELGIVDALVNNAWLRGPASVWGPFLRVAPPDWRRFTEENLAMLYLMTHRAASRLAASGRPGAIVNLSSHGALRAHRNHIPWDSVKGATDSFTRSTAVDLAPWRIRVNAIRPGAVENDEDALTPEQAELRSSQIPLGRAGVPGDIAGSVVFLASELSSWVTGQIFNVDGGMSAQARAPQVEFVPVWTPENLPLP